MTRNAWRLPVKLMLLLGLMAGTPLLVAFGLSSTLIQRSLEAGLNPAVGEALEDAVTVFGERIQVEKARQRALAAGLADSARLQRALTLGDLDTAGRLLDLAVREDGVLSVALLAGGRPALHRQRPAPEPGTAEPLRETLTLPVPAATGYHTLEYTFGFDPAYLTRFQRMESEVIAPFNALEADRDRRAGLYTWSLIAMLAAAILVAGAVAVLAGGRITRRINRLRTAMARVAAGRWDTRVAPSGHDEVTELMEGFNQMARQLDESRNRIEYLTQISAWQGIARRMAHEIKNPLTPILLSVQQAESGYLGDDPAHRRTLSLMRRIVEQEVGTLRRLVDAFSRFAQLPTMKRGPCDVAALCRELPNAHPDIPGLDCHVPTGTLPAFVDEGLLRQAMNNLVINAHQAVAPTGRVPHIVVDCTPADDGHRLRLSVTDNGPGVPTEARERIFEPYFTGRPDGTGLGLAIVKRIAVDHGGSVEVQDAPGGGAVFRLTLPRETSGSPSGSMPEGGPSADDTGAHAADRLRHTGGDVDGER